MPRGRRRRDREAEGKDTPCEAAAAPRAGLPDPDSVVSETELTSPSGRRYRVIRTTEKDAYEEPTPPSPENPPRP